jgi:predicted nucleotidyltransferase component of viral defense system
MLNQSKHKDILGRILIDIYRDTFLAKNLAFKGGTMAYLLYGLNRMSVDLDFDILDLTTEKKVIEKIQVILERYGKIKDSHNKMHSIFFLMNYEIGQHNIKIDINKRQFSSSYEIKKYLGVTMQCMVLSDTIAHKMVALYERMEEATRDIFDVHFFLSQSFNINTDIITARTGLTYSDFVDVLISKLEQVPSNMLLSGLGELIDEKQKVWVKNTMISELLPLLHLSKEVVG